MKQQILAFALICLLVHRMLDLYGVYSKWKQVHRQYTQADSSLPIPRDVRWIVTNFPKLSMGIVYIAMVVFSAVLLANSDANEYLISTMPGLFFSIVVSGLGFYADFHRESFFKIKRA